MITRDLGRLDRPLLVFGGPYSNLQSLEALIKEADRLGLSGPDCLCTGDVVAYCADAKATTDLIRGWGCHVVMGNCEESLGTSSADCGCGFEEGSACDLLSRQWFAHASASLTSDDRAWMQSRPRRITGQIGAARFAAIHGGWAGGKSAINRFLFESCPAARFRDEIEALEDDQPLDLILAGHAGLPFARNIDGRIWLNAGVIGMPANDGETATWYAVCEPDGTYRFHRLTYDQTKPAKAMRAAGLSEGYAKALETGVWPNMDILPETERKRVGRPIGLGE